MDQKPQNMPSPSSKKYVIIAFVSLIFVLLVVGGFYLSSSKQRHTATVIPTPSQPNQPTEQTETQTKSESPPLTQEQLDDWNQKLTSGSVADFQAVMRWPENKPVNPSDLQHIASMGPFHFKLETLKAMPADADTTASIEVELNNDSTDATKPATAYLVVVNGKWMIVDILPAASPTIIDK